jgi:hypothetical protein|tara:strand:- start:922 stop:1110 length:189 start_codon:yes stop_codon:yes gene_type:complete
LDSSFENFQWYDLPVILFFANALSTLFFATLMGGGFMAGVLLLMTWEGWKFYESWRAKSLDN